MYLQAFIRPSWQDLQTFVEVERYRETLHRELTCEKHYYITSLPLKKSTLIHRAIRSHWHTVESRVIIINH